MSTKKPKTPAHPRSKKASLDEKARHTQAQADYRAWYIGSHIVNGSRRAQIKESEESSKEAAEQRREADAEYREMKRMRTYVDRHGLLALTNHYIPLKQQAGAKYMPGILAEGSSQATTTSRRRTTTPTPRSPTGWFQMWDYSPLTANSQCGPDVEGRWKQHARRRHAEEEWASICARHHHHPSPTNEDDDEVVPDSEAENDGDNDNRGSVPVSRALTMAPAPRRRRRRNGTQLTPAHSAPAPFGTRAFAPARSAPARSAPTRSTAVLRGAAPPPHRSKSRRRPFVVKQGGPQPKFKKQESMDPPLDPPSRRSGVCLKSGRHRSAGWIRTTRISISSADSPNNLANTEARWTPRPHVRRRGGCPPARRASSPRPMDAPTRSPTEAAVRAPAAASSPRPMDAPTRSPTEAAVPRARRCLFSRPMDAPSRAPSTTVRKHKARTRAAPPVATLITSSPAPASPRPPAPVSARAPTTVGATAPAPALAHAPAPALACESTASPARMAARELNSRAGVHLAPPAVLAPALELVSASDSNGRSTTRSGERPDPARERTVPDSFSPVPRSTIDMPQPMRHRAPVTYATPARSICVRGSESPSRHNSKSPNPGPSGAENGTRVRAPILRSRCPVVVES
ncbi:hypothetical protein B0H14DRAFT_2558666 [Mycena olivaceomarginata]|nr:hypothetical protein B0H14DRAFT_2558666 [Mycena olivaceomarginata]